MLSHLQICDFAIIDRLELELGPGMTAVTGETGAGKSILVDALGLVLGERADSTTVRHGAERADISAVFDLEHLPAARRWLAGRDLDLEPDCHLRRVVSGEGRSRAYINGSPQPLQALREFGDLLVDIHGQHEHQSLLKRELQRQLLDDYGGHPALLAELGEHFQAWTRLRRRLENLQRAALERESRLDLLRYQVQELQTLNLQADEVPALEEEQRRLANAGRLLENSRQILDRLYEDESLSVHSLLNQFLRDLESLGTLDARLAPITELLNAALIQVQEAGDELRRYLHHLDLDPGRLEWVDQRLADVHALARKHRLSPGELPVLLERLQTELDALETSELREERLGKELKTVSEAYFRCAETLSGRRAAAAETLKTKVSEAMHGLGMPGGRFEVALERGDKPTPYGLESVEFRVSANPGQPVKPLNKVASGGELSRISLAIQVITARAARIPTLVFDEVDTGIGGGVAEIVGRQLRTLGESRQVLCVTHLPQVAAQAHQHLQVSKQTGPRSTRTLVAALCSEERIGEIARMLGGIELTDNTLAHAREMIERAQHG